MARITAALLLLAVLSCAVIAWLVKALWHRNFASNACSPPMTKPKHATWRCLLRIQMGTELQAVIPIDI